VPGQLTVKDNALQKELISLLAARKGHFLLESGHHGDLWLDLELLCLRPKQIEPFVEDLARQLQPHTVDAVCGPFNEGAFVALMWLPGWTWTFTMPSVSNLPRGTGCTP